MILYYLKIIIGNCICSLNFCCDIMCIISSLFLSFSYIIRRHNRWSFCLDNGRDIIYVIIWVTLDFGLSSYWDLTRKTSQVIWCFGVRYLSLSKGSCLEIFIEGMGIISRQSGLIRSWSRSIWIVSFECLRLLSCLFFSGWKIRIFLSDPSKKISLLFWIYSSRLLLQPI